MLGEGTTKSRNWSVTLATSWAVWPEGSLARMREASSSSRGRGRAEVNAR